MSKALRAAANSLTQWPPLALAWAIHGALVFYLFFAFVPADRVAPGQLLQVGSGLLLLLLTELGLLLLLNLVVEGLTGWVLPKSLVDLLKSLAVALVVGVLAASVLKFTATSVHLRRTDLWFAWTNFRRILEEATLADAAGFLMIPTGVLLLAAGLFAGMRRFRRRPRPRRPLLTLLPAAVAAPALVLLWAVSPPLRLFSEAFIPEIHWLRSVLDRPGFAAVSPPPDGAGKGRTIRPYRPDRRADAPNVVLVMLESIPWQRTTLGGAPAGVTPNIDRLAAESVVFSRAYSVSTHSDYAQMAILSSLHPRKYERHDYYVRIEYPRTLLWDALAPAGYTTSMFSCQNERWGNMLNYLDTRGLDVLKHSLDWPRARHRGRGAESKVYEETPVSEWKLWREAHPQEPLFTYFNFQSNHFPYELPPEEPRPFIPYAIDFQASFLRYPRDKVPVMLNRFFNALAYADRMLGEIIDFLERRGEWERTVLIVVSDHGEAFYEHGQPTHGTSLLEEQVRSLWLMRVPGEPARRVDEPVSLLDLGPTLLELLDLPAHDNFQGRSDILEPDYYGGDRPLLFAIQGLTFEDGLLLDDWKYIVNWDQRTRRLYDLANDPQETVDLMDSRTDKALEMDRVLRDLVTGQLAYYREERWKNGLYPPPLP